MTVETHPEALLEIESAAKWYLGHSNAADRFRAEVREAIRRIVANPQLYGRILDEYRACYLHKFPYQIVFLAEGERIQVVAVAHTSREPLYWQHRI